MKNVLFVMLLLFPVYISAQTKTTAKPSQSFVKLDAKDPLIGEWEWIQDPTGSPYAPFPEVDFTFLRFSPKDSLSVGAIENNETKGLLGAGYFLAYSNGSIIMGVLSGCSNPAHNGKSFKMYYEVLGNELVITAKGERIYYRKKS